MNVETLLDRWRSEAETFEARGMVREATMARSFAADLEAFAREYLFATLTVEHAAEEAGVCAETIRRRVRRGELHDVGEGGRIAIRRAELLNGTDSDAGHDRGEPDVVSLLNRGRWRNA